MSPKPLFQSTGKQLFPKPGGALFKTAVIAYVIDVDLKDLEQYSAKRDILDQARQIIVSTNLNNLNYETVLEWGSDVQKEHANMLEKLLTQLNSPDMNGPRELFNQVLTILDNLRPSRIFKKGFFGGDKRDEFNSIYDHLRKKLNDLKEQIPKIKSFKHDLDKLKDQIKCIESRIEPYVVAASFFSQYKKDDFPLDLFVSRLTGLITTKAALQSNKETQKTLEQNTINFLDAINNVLLNEVPLFLSNYLNILTQTNPDIKQLEEKYTTLCSTLKKQ